MKTPLKTISITALIFATSLASAAHAAETDNFTGRDQQLAALSDSLPVLDEFVNRNLHEAIEAANLRGSCDARLLYRNVWNRVGRNPISETENFVESSPAISKYLVPFKQSIYGGVPTFIHEKRSPRVADLFILSGWFSESIRLNGQIIGTDKLGHFFGQGWEYFQTGSLKDALALGVQDEEGLDGYIGSGVYSYGDLSANSSGLKFWRSLVNGEDPYVKCASGKFFQARHFSWRDYVTPAWDEALNCSKYVTPEMQNAIDLKLSRMGMSCPVDRSACKAMINASPCSAITVNPVCFSIAGLSLEQKRQECEKEMEGSSWREAAHSSLDQWDRLLIKADTFLGIAGMSLHFIKRDYFTNAATR